ncbi:MAG TPA: endo-1,4-beta-xylanase [Longimicrobiaceae bacterium]
MADRNGVVRRVVERTWGRWAVGIAAALVWLTAPAPISAQEVARDSATVPATTKFLGNVWSPRQAADFLKYWDQITPENAGKWRNMEPRRDEFDWRILDEAYEAAQQNGLPFRFHVLVWGNQQPAWIEELPPHEQLEEIEERMAAIAERYPEIDFVEVVNEPIHDPPRKRNAEDRGAGDYIEALGGEGESGWDWVLNAFRMARRHFPEAALVLNEYSVINNDETTDRYLEIIRLLQAEDLIQVIGIQGHSFSTTGSSEVMRRNLDRLAATGLPIQVMEMDVDGEDDARQLSEYQRIFPIFWEHPAVSGITLWGWRPGLWRGRFGANLLREDGSLRPSMEWLLEYTGRKR